jgi:endoglycosylceramidase
VVGTGAPVSAASVTIIAAACLTVGCSGKYAATYAPVDSDGHMLRDEEGRSLVLRGFNAKQAGIFDVSFSDGRAPREDVPPFDADDAALIRSHGFNVIRLPINWSAIEPQPQQYQSAYLDKVAAFVAICRAASLYVLLDFHEDGYSKELCEDGAPVWAIVPLPAVLPPGGPPASWDCHTSPAAVAAHTSFFADADGLQESFAAMAKFVATRFAEDRTVIGYELFNEPITSDDLAVAFAVKTARAIRLVDPKHLIAWEPSSLRNITNSAMVGAQPFPVPGSVYAVHIYTSYTGDWHTRLSDSIHGARDEANSWGTPLMVTEHAGDPMSDGLTWDDIALDAFDDVRASSMSWIWNPGTVTRNPDGSFAFVFGGQILQHLSRPYAPAVGGDVNSTVWDGTRLTVAFRGRGDVPARHDVFWNPERPAPRITCDGKAIAATSVNRPDGLYTVACGGPGAHTLVFE